MRRLPLLVLVALASCTSSPDDVRIFDACEPLVIDAPGATADQIASLDAAIASWREIGVTPFVRSDQEPAIALTFVAGAPTSFGFYDDTGSIYINDGLSPAASTIAIAHELGHTVGLRHIAAKVRPSVMNPGNLEIAPAQAESDAVVDLWGACVRSSP